MKRIRNITTTFLVLALLLVMGLGGAAHAMASDCVGGHCDDHMVNAVESHLGHTVVQPADSGSSSMITGECDPFFCSILALPLLSSETAFDQSKTALIWPVARLKTLKKPDNPDRPPNL